jgi:phosphoesterase RecJ-like protein
LTPPPELIDQLNRLQRPVIAGHINPDVDALSAMLALARLLPCRGAITLPRTHLHLNKKAGFALELTGDVPLASDEYIAQADAIVVLDAATTGRINVPGKWESIADRNVINIDHHITNTDYGRMNWVVGDASSTSEMIFHLAQAAGWIIDSTTACLLYAGLYADTGAFSLPNTTPQAFDVAASLVRMGADVERVGNRLLRNHHQSEFDLLRVVYHNTRLVHSGLIAYSTLSHEEITRVGCTQEDIDDQVSIPRSLSGVRVAVLFSEIEPGLVRVNLRGENGTPVLSIATALGGGGHQFSAGVRVRGPFESVIQRVLGQAMEYLEANTGA